MAFEYELLMALGAGRHRDPIEAARRGELVAAARRRRVYEAVRTQGDVVIRLSRGSDGPALERLAALSERQLPAGSFVVAEERGELVAALPLDADVPGPALADPFRPSLAIVDLLELRARQVHEAEGRGGVRRGALRLAALWQRPSRRAVRV
jgi:hypothetical protein